MSDPIASMPLERFITALSSMIFTDEEIAHWIRNHQQLSTSQKRDLTRAIAELKGKPPITGIIRTALRELDGLPPVPGDPT